VAAERSNTADGERDKARATSATAPPAAKYSAHETPSALGDLEGAVIVTSGPGPDNG
jgi:hypothetical protein